ncbi:MAG: type VI secretion system-associated FHA domain protein TagH [Paracoccaceae bacterium]
MGLTLSVLRCPDAVPPETRQVSGGEFSIGRGTDNSWTLPDPDRTLSRRHCVLAFRSGGWQLADVSANGTYLNREAEPLGEAGPRDLRDGDRLRLGAYEIEIRISQEAAWQGGGQAGGRASDPFGDDPFAAARPAPQGFERDPLLSDRGAFGTPSVTLPADYDPLAPEQGGSGFRGPTQPDNAPALEQAFRVPVPPSKLDFDDWDLDLSKPAPPPSAPPPPSARATSVDDWDIDLSPAAVAPPPPPPPPPQVPVRTEARPASPPPASPMVEAAPPPVTDTAAHEDPFAEPERDGTSPVPVLPAIPTHGTIPPRARAAAPPPPSPETRPSQPSTSSQPPATGDLLAAFLRGAGMEDARPADAEATMEKLGAAFRALVTGLRQTLIARAAIKGEFRIEQTMIRARGNNPLKFSAGDDDALAALLGAGRRTEMTPAAAVGEALDDIRLHELAAMAAMQTAVRSLIERFDPAPLRIEGDRSGGMLGAQKRARAFELFEKLHGDITAALTDDFDSVFGKAFSRAYEQALREVSNKPR